MKLIICEKAMAALRIATILSNSKFKTERIGSVPIHLFENGKSMVVGLRGHIIGLDYPEKYVLWNRTKPRELIRVTPCKKVNEKAIAYSLKKLAKDINEIIIATDFDREGELIGVETLEILKEIKPDIRVKRARFSALTEEEITNAFDNLSDVDYNLSKSAETRQIIDLVWGATLTRFISLASGQLGKYFLSVGRVQSPTLRLIVDREKEIKMFKPKPYWEIEGIFEKDKKRFSAKHVEGRFWENEKAKNIFENIKSAKKALVLSVIKKQKKEKPPAPFNTTSFLQSATSLGFSASNAMSIAENLYQEGLISYPRTDNTVYPETLNLRNILKKLSTMFPEAKEILSLKVLKPTRGKKLTTDHPPIHPVSVPKNRLTPEQHKIYELVVRRFFATLAPEMLFETTDVSLSVNNEKFISSGYRIIEQGWRKYYPYIKTKETLLPVLEKDDAVNILKMEMLKKETQPPKRYSQGSLIQFMEKLGLGTKSTRHEIIKKLYSRGYIQSKQPVPTKTGFAVTEALENYAEPITNHGMTSTLEEEMNQIAEGKRRQDEVVSESQDMLEKVMDVLEKNGEKIGEKIKTALEEENIVGPCPECGNKMIIIRSKKGKRFAGCTSFPKCANSYPLPQKGRIIPLNEKCEFCGAPTIKLITKKGQMSFCINMECPGRNVTKTH
ncbi:MAG: DNA topoisomerase I [Thermoplasmatales archaeon]|nr:DNA topoisomerase I [Thermoplasmatales archaeon]